jgi:putative SOS response-associated peptidase YedK
VAATGAKVKQPYHIHLAESQPFAFAGLWETWHKDDNKVESCTILTKDAAGEIKKLHDRMPVTIPPERFAEWLDATKPHDLQPILESGAGG